MLTKSPLCLMVPAILYAGLALATLDSSFSQSLFVALHESGRVPLLVFPVIDKYHHEMMQKLGTDRAFAITSINIFIGYIGLLYVLIAAIFWRQHYAIALGIFEQFTRNRMGLGIVRAMGFIGMANVVTAFAAAGLFESNIGERRYPWNAVTHFDSNLDTMITSAIFASFLWAFPMGLFMIYILTVRASSLSGGR